MKQEVIVRTISGLSLGFLGAISIAYTGFNYLFAFFSVLAYTLLGVREFYILTDRSQQERAFYKTGMFFSVFIVLCYYAHFLYLKRQSGDFLSEYHNTFVHFFYPGFSLVVPVLVLLFMTTAIVHMLSRLHIQGIVYSVSLTLFGVVYTVITVCQGFLIYSLPYGKFYILLFLILPISADVGAYFSGLSFGKHKVGLKTSPNKTYEGYIGGLIFTCFVGLAYLWVWQESAWQYPDMGYIEMFFLSFLIAIFSPIGDLMESAIKRDMDRKDSSHSIPGHGGILDLLDAIYWSLPIGYLYLVFRDIITT